MTDKQKAVEAAWLEYYGKGTPEEPPMMPPAFRRGFEDGVKWERKREAIDCAVDDSKVRELARPHLPQGWVDGDSDCVPDMVGIVEKLVWWIEARKRESPLGRWK